MLGLMRSNGQTRNRHWVQACLMAHCLGRDHPHGMPGEGENRHEPMRDRIRPKEGPPRFWNKPPSHGVRSARLGMDSKEDGADPHFVALVERLSHTLFHLRNNQDRIHMRAVLDIFVTFLTVLPDIKEGGPVMEDIEQMVLRTSGLYLHD